MSRERLDKVLCYSTGLSRKEAKNEIANGKVSVNGKVEKNSQIKIDTLKDSILYNNNFIDYKEHIYIMMNKPKGLLSACSDSKRETVIDILSKEHRRVGIAPVGRLDKDTTGLLLITTDGNFAHKVISPKSMVEKKYIVTLDGEITQSDIKKIEDGIVLVDGTKCLPAMAKVLSKNQGRDILELCVFEGKYHQVKRMMGVLGLGVNELHRAKIGQLVLDESLEYGQYRLLSYQELSKIFI